MLRKAITCTFLLAIVSLSGLSGCRDAAEFFHWAGTPTGQDGWLHDYDSTPNDTWEAFRVIMRDNGSITTEDPAKMELRGVYKPHDSSARDGIEVKGNVYDKSEDGEVRSRLIVHCWYARNANDRERPDTAREYCNAVFRLLKAWKGEPIDEKPTVSTTSMSPSHLPTEWPSHVGSGSGGCARPSRKICRKPGMAPSIRITKTFGVWMNFVRST